MLGGKRGIKVGRSTAGEKEGQRRAPISPAIFPQALFFCLFKQAMPAKKEARGTDLRPLFQEMSLEAV